MRHAISCDTSVVLGSATADGSVIFAKNSDRAPNECQPLTHIPGRRHGPRELVRCQYLSIPQVPRTWEVIGSRPYWLWGFEIGVNEWGLAIGNEAVHTREPYEEIALIGMDLVRLGLERARNAEEAVDVIGALVERHGQGGSCEANSFRTYQNSFIVADPNSAWVLETAGHRWVAEGVVDRAAISNLLTIHGGDRSSPGIETHAREQGWVEGDFDFAHAYQDPEADLSTRVCRLERARSVLGGHRQPFDVQAMMSLLRDHGDGDLPTGAQALPTICMHANPAFAGETAAAMVVHLHPNRPREIATTCWTAFGSPCLSVFRPVYPFAVGLPGTLDCGDAHFDAASPWWQFERLQRLVAQAPSLAGEVRSAYAALECDFFAEADETESVALDALESGDRDGAIRVLGDLVDSTTRRAIDLTERLTIELAERSSAEALPVLAEFWETVNRDVGLHPEDSVRQMAAGIR
ncbi:MAG TPA: C69 family dipeptidase [Thermomicrobiales bacterium]